MKIYKIFFLTVLSVLFFSSQLLAAWCQGKPLPEQKSFWVFETSWKTRFADSNTRLSKDKFLLTGELGYIKNMTPNYSIGATLYGSGDDDAGNFGIKFRYRRWLTKTVSFDISPGILLAGSDNYQTVKYPGFVASTSIGVRDLIAFDLQFQAVRYNNSGIFYPYTNISAPLSNSGTQTGWYIGVRFGSYAAVISTVTALVIGAILVSSIDDQYY